MLLAVPAIYATGGAATPILPLAYLVVAHAAYALSARDAALRTGAMLGILIATLVVNVQTATFTGVSVIVGEVLVIAAPASLQPRARRRGRARPRWSSRASTH